MIRGEFQPIAATANEESMVPIDEANPTATVVSGEFGDASAVQASDMLSYCSPRLAERQFGKTALAARYGIGHSHHIVIPVAYSK
jgi:hypothetical protein